MLGKNPRGGNFSIKPDWPPSEKGTYSINGNYMQKSCKNQKTNPDLFPLQRMLLLVGPKNWLFLYPENWMQQASSPTLHQKKSLLMALG
jgi:hypothetical protein